MAKIITTSIQQEASKAMREYAISVISGRAIPDIRDGQKPVQRRLLNIGYLGYPANRPYSKSARIVGDTMGRLHPHGDTSIYDAMVRMSQSWVYNIPLIDGQGNFGSIDGDSPAAMRYTEMRLTKAASTMTEDLKELPANWNQRPNYDGKEMEYAILPARFPVLPVNGAEGVGVGLATKIPPHNLREIIAAATALIHNPDMTVSELQAIVPGPDFPTGGILQDDEALATYAENGGGTLYIEGRWTEEASSTRRNQKNIIISEIPYGITKSALLEQIENLRRGTMEIPRGKGECYPPLSGISQVRDESDKEVGFRIVIELKGSADLPSIMRDIRQKTIFRIPFSCNFTALNIHDRPERMNLLAGLRQLLLFRRETVWERSFETLTRHRNILEKDIPKYIIADRINEIIDIIRSANGRDDAIEKLCKIPFPSKGHSKESPWELADLIHHTNPDIVISGDTYHLNSEQAAIIVDLRLHFLTKLSRNEIVKSIEKTIRNIREMEEIVESDDLRDQIIIREMEEIGEKYGQDRKTSISGDIIMTSNGGRKAKNEDVVPARVWITEKGLMAKSETPPHREGDSLLYGTIIAEKAVVLTADGNAIQVPSGQIMPDPVYPEALAGQPQALGMDVDPSLDPDGPKFLLFVTSMGNIRKSPVGTFINNRRISQAMKLPDGEKIIAIYAIKGNEEIALLCEGDETRTIRFSLDAVNPINSKASTGVRGINMKGETVVTASRLIIEGSVHEESSIITKDGKEIDPTALSVAARGGRGTPVK